MQRAGLWQKSVTGCCTFLAVCIFDRDALAALLAGAFPGLRNEQVVFLPAIQQRQQEGW